MKQQQRNTQCSKLTKRLLHFIRAAYILQFTGNKLWL